MKCDHYWPFDEEPVELQDLTVTMTNEETLPNWTIRYFDAYNNVSEFEYSNDSLYNPK